MRTKTALLSIILFVAVAATGADKDKFIVRTNGEFFGTEEYSITSDAKGYKVKSTASSQQPGRISRTDQEQLLEPDFTFRRYSLASAEIEGIRTVEATRDKDKIRMSVRSPHHEPRVFAVPMAARIIVLDNMVVSQFQVLLDSFRGQAPAPDYGFLVPQSLTLLPGGVTQLPRQQQATLNGKEISVRKYSVNAGGLIMECWAEATNNKLMRVWVPTQKVEFIREGFALTGSTPAAPGSH
jgi:hypothetical protein